MNSVNNTIFRVIDDSGLIGIIDPVAYSGFVGEFWEWSELIEMFHGQMRERHLLLWGTDMENSWRVKVTFEPAITEGFRELVGTVSASDGLLLLTSFDSLTMAAEDEDTDLPEPRNRDLLLRVESGTYRCRIIQLHDHDYRAENGNIMEAAEAHYVLELLRSDVFIEPWKDVPWAPP